LVTDVLEAERLTREEAADVYRKRWPASECAFRTWKHTFWAEKLVSRTPLIVEQECEFSLCALQLMGLNVCLEWREKRRDRRALAKGRQSKSFREELRACVGDTYQRRKSKVRCRWPERKEHHSIKRPQFRKLGKRRKALWISCFEE